MQRLVFRRHSLYIRVQVLDVLPKFGQLIVLTLDGLSIERPRSFVRFLLQLCS